MVGGYPVSSTHEKLMNTVSWILADTKISSSRKKQAWCKKCILHFFDIHAKLIDIHLCLYPSKYVSIHLYNPFLSKKSKSLPPVQIHIGRYRTRRGVIDFFLLSWNMERVQGTAGPSKFQWWLHEPFKHQRGFLRGSRPLHILKTPKPQAHWFFGGLKLPPSSPSSFSAPAQKKSPNGVWDP